MAYDSYELNRMPCGDRIQDTLQNLYGVCTIPVVFIRGKLIGGRNEIESMYVSGQLHHKLKHSSRSKSSWAQTNMCNEFHFNSHENVSIFPFKNY